MEGVISRAGILKGLLDILPYRQHATADNLLTQSPDPTTAPIRQQLKININHLSTYRLSWSIDPHLIQICRRDRKSISTVTNIDLYRICTIHKSDQYNRSQKKELNHWKYVVAKIKKQAQQQWDLSKRNMDKQKLDTITNALPIQGFNPWTTAPLIRCKRKKTDIRSDLLVRKWT